MSELTSEALVSIQKLTKDIKTAATTLTEKEARFLVDLYYQMQDNRIRSAGQVRSMSEEPHTTLAWFNAQAETLETQVKNALGAFADSRAVGKWSLAQYGIGPVISAGLIAHVDVKIANTAGKVWAFAGLAPDRKWEKGQKRPWNASLKTLAWKIGQSFMKFSGKEDCFYGRLYVQRKMQEIARNERGELAQRAIEQQERLGKSTEARVWVTGCYPAGAMTAIQGLDLTARNRKLKELLVESGKGVPMLAPAHIDARARRWTVKLFLSHWHQVAYRAEFGVNPPRPYVLDILGHADEIQVPGWPF